MTEKEKILHQYSNEYLEYNCVKVFDGTYGEYTYDDSSYNDAWDYAKDKYEEEYGD
jgi:hypothetical protein